MRLGLVTYNLAKDWDVPTLIERCAATRFEGVELRTTHAHGVEVTLGARERQAVRKRFEDSPVALVGLGSAFEYHAVQPEVVRQNIEGTKECVKLAHDVGAAGVKVRPNGFQDEVGIPREQTLEQIGLSLRECGAFARDYGVEIRLEVHGPETCKVPYIVRIMEIADHDNVFVCWNSNLTDVDETGSVASNFNLVQGKIRLLHITELYNETYGAYPYRELFGLLKGIGYEGFCCAEIAENPEPERLMRYYRALFEAYVS
ncbi:MAG: TIM barrel protein [Candidatus Latescibacterota bacterium]